MANKCYRGASTDIYSILKDLGIEWDLKERKDVEVPIEGFSGKGNSSHLGQAVGGLLGGNAIRGSASNPSRKGKSPQSYTQDKGMSSICILGSDQLTQVASVRQALQSSPEGLTPG